MEGFSDNELNTIINIISMCVKSILQIIDVIIFGFKHEN